MILLLLCGWPLHLLTITRNYLSFVHFLRLIQSHSIGRVLVSICIQTCFHIILLVIFIKIHTYGYFILVELFIHEPIRCILWPLHVIQFEWNHAFRACCSCSLSTHVFNLKHYLYIFLCLLFHSLSSSLISCYFQINSRSWLSFVDVRFQSWIFFIWL